VRSKTGLRLYPPDAATAAAVVVVLAVAVAVAAVSAASFLGSPGVS